MLRNPKRQPATQTKQERHEFHPVHHPICCKNKPSYENKENVTPIEQPYVTF
jgi:hypothetical protein